MIGGPVITVAGARVSRPRRQAHVQPIRAVPLQNVVGWLDYMETRELDSGDRHTKLGLRINRPRVYVVAALGGGTGSGMFLDVAYAARHQLKRLGYQQPDVVGLFFLPTADSKRSKPMALGNTFAALRELHHFGSAGVIYTARYAAKQPPLTDAEPPFSRCTLLPVKLKTRRRAT